MAVGHSAAARGPAVVAGVACTLVGSGATHSSDLAERGPQIAPIARRALAGLYQVKRWRLQRDPRANDDRRAPCRATAHLAGATRGAACQAKRRDMFGELPRQR